MPMHEEKSSNMKEEGAEALEPLDPARYDVVRPRTTQGAVIFEDHAPVHKIREIGAWRGPEGDRLLLNPKIDAVKRRGKSALIPPEEGKSSQGPCEDRRELGVKSSMPIFLRKGQSISYDWLYPTDILSGGSDSDEEEAHEHEVAQATMDRLQSVWVAAAEQTAEKERARDANRDEDELARMIRSFEDNANALED